MGQDLGFVSKLLISLHYPDLRLLRMPPIADLAFILPSGIVPGSLDILKLRSNLIPDPSLMGSHYSMLALPVIQDLSAQEGHFETSNLSDIREKSTSSSVIIESHLHSATEVCSEGEWTFIRSRKYPNMLLFFLHFPQDLQKALAIF
jgi:hypothetical protein